MPGDAIALAINVTTTAPNQPGYFTAFPAGHVAPEASLLNTDRGGQTRAASSITPISAAGLSVYSHSGGHVIIDVTGWFTGPSAGESADGLFVPADSPQRLVDTRTGDPLWPGGAIEVAGPCDRRVVDRREHDARRRPRVGLPHRARGATTVPETSTVNAGAKHQTAANLAIVPVSSSGIAVSSFGGADLVVDLAGWFVGSPVGAHHRRGTDERSAAGVHRRHERGIADRVLASGDPIIGADYQRAYPLPDGRTMWMFQDVLLRSRAGSRSSTTPG